MSSRKQSSNAASSNNSPIPKRVKTKQLSLLGKTIAKLAVNKKLLGQSILLNDTVYGNSPPDNCKGYLYAHLVLKQEFVSLNETL